MTFEEYRRWFYYIYTYRYVQFTDVWMCGISLHILLLCVSVRLFKIRLVFDTGYGLSDFHLWPEYSFVTDLMWTLSTLSGGLPDGFTHPGVRSLSVSVSTTLDLLLLRCHVYVPLIDSKCLSQKFRRWVRRENELVKIWFIVGERSQRMTIRVWL